MAVLALAAAGSAIGASIGGSFLWMTAAQAGWTAGAMVGSLLFAPHTHTEGARLSDLKVQNSTYGMTLPILYGTSRMAGNVIWSSDLIEHSKTESAGGKGGSSDYTSYTYSVNCAVALCEGEIFSVRRIWANGKLIYDRSTGAKITGSSKNIRVYTGSETQAVDPLIESYVGVGNTPAYRGTAYVVFEDFYLTDYGNTIPSFAFEVVGSGAGASATERTWGAARSMAVNPNDGTVWTVNTTRTVTIYDSVTEAVLQNIVTSSDCDLTDIIYCADTDEMWVVTSGFSWGYTYGLLIFDATGRAYVNKMAPLGSAWQMGPPQYDPFRNRLAVPLPNGAIVSVDVAGRTAGTVIGGINQITGGIYLPELRIFVWPLTAGTPGLLLTDAITDAVIGYVYESRGTVGFNPLAWIPETQQIWWFNNGHLRVLGFSSWNGDVASITVVEDWLALTHNINCAYYKSGDGYVYGAGSSGVTAGMLVIDASTRAIVDTISSSQALGTQMVQSPANNEDLISLWASTGAPLVTRNTRQRVTISTVPLSTIVSDLCRRSWLTAGDIDVTALTDSVRGYTIANQATIRANIETLQKAFFFDAVESDSKIKFVKRGGSSVVTIPTDDLAAHAYGAEVPAIVDVQRLEESELPREVNVAYPDVDLDYQVGTQYARRLTGNSNNIVSLQLSVVLTASEAKQIADKHEFSAWAERETVGFSTGRKYAKYEPTDVITIDDGSVSRTLRIVDKNEDGSGLITWTTASQTASAYSQTSSGVSASFSSQTLAQLFNTRLLMLDMPILLDSEDSSAGFYLAAAGYGTPWAGGEVFRSTDSGSTFADIASVTVAAIMGAASTVLGDFSGGNVFDEMNSVTVSLMAGGTLASVSELPALNGSNCALLGDEVIIFKNATLVSTGVYTLSGLLRGRAGTEWAINTHANGERFVLMTKAGISRIESASADLNLARSYKAVTFGNALSSVPWQSFTNTGIGLKTYAPVQVRGGRDGSAGIVIDWVRRNRTRGAWLDYVDVPNTEASEAYEVDIYTNSAFTMIKRSITGLTTPTFTYTSAQQVTDFGSTQTAVYLKVYQKSAIVGRGTPATTTLAVPL